MTRNPQLEQLLDELPEERLPELLDFLRGLTRQSMATAETPSSDTSISFQ
jgi:hypothetical protein